MRLKREMLKRASKYFKYLRGAPKYLAPALGLAVGLASVQSARALTLYGTRGASQNELIRFDSGSPTSVTSIGTISGLQPGERVVGMDYSSFLGRVFVLGSTSRIYRLNLNTAQATAISSAPFTPAINTINGYGFECDRASAQARIIRGVVNNPYNSQVSLTTGAVTATNTNPTLNPVGLAQSATGASTAFYGIDFTADRLIVTTDVTTGNFTNVGAGLGIGTGTSADFGFDITPDGVPLFSYTIAPTTKLYTLNLTTGVASALGNIGNGTQPVGSLTAAPVPNAGQITINDVAPASPYPSTITVSGSANIPLSRVRVRLNNISHTALSDVRVLLVGPTGQSVMLLGYRGSDVSNVDLLLDDDAASPIPNGPLSTGTFKPSASLISLSNLPAPAPAAPYASALSVFKGTAANGDWKLFVSDEFSGDVGQIAEGWDLLLDQAPSEYSLDAPAYTVSENVNSLPVTINRSGNVAFADSVTLATTNGSALSGSDYTGFTPALTVAFAAGETTKTIPIPILNDALAEPQETLSVVLAASSSASLVNGFRNVPVTINDDDGPSVISVSNAAIAEGAPGTSASATFTATLDRPALLPVTFSYAATDNSGDFVSETGTATFAAGATSTSFTIASIGDFSPEPDESFGVALFSPINAVLAAPGATLTLTNDDAATPTISMAPVTVIEGAIGTQTDANFVATLSAPSAVPVLVSYGIAAGSDYIATSGTLYFAPGATSTGFSIKVVGDNTPEPNESFNVALFNPIGAPLAVGGAALTITNDDAPISIASFSPGFGAPGNVVLIRGANLGAASGVTFNNVPALFTILTSGAQSQIRATVPLGATTGRIRITTPIGIATSTTDFKIPPVIASALTTSGAAGTFFFVTGQNLGDVTSVKINNVVSPFVRVSPTLLRITIPPLATSGFIAITSPGGTVVSRFQFSVLPTITSFAPARATVGSIVTITGTGFTLVRQVLFGTGVTTPLSVSPTRILVRVPANATSGPITVVTAAGRAPSRTSFAILLSTGTFTPARGAAGTVVTINGTGFVGIRSVFFNNIAATSFRVVSPTQIQAVVPASATTGRIRVLSVANGEATTTGVFTVVSAPAV